MKTKPITKELHLLVDQSCVLNTTSEKVISIEPRLSHILEILITNRGKVVKREAIIEAVWGNYNSGQELLTHSISMLRKSIGKNIIITIPKKGYMIGHPVLPIQSYQNNLLRRYAWVFVIAAIAIFKAIIPWHH